MAAGSFTPATFPPSGKLVLDGGMVGFIGTYKGNASYATGGDGLAAGQTPLAELKHVLFLNSFDSLGTLYAIWIAADAKVKVFDAFGTEEGAGTDLSAKEWQIMVIGYGG